MLMIATCKEKLNAFFQTDLFLVIYGAEALICWILGWDIVHCALTAALGCLIFLICEDLRPFLGLVCVFITGMSTRQLGTAGFNVALGVLIPLLVLSFGYYAYRNWYKKGVALKPGKLWLGIAMAGGVAVLSGLFCPEYNHWLMFAVLGASAGLYFYYFLMINATGSDLKKLLGSALFITSAVALLEMFWHYFTSGDISAAMQDKVFHGYATTNNVAVFFCMAVPLCLYRAVKSRRGWLYVLWGLALLAGVFLTRSRGCLLVLGILLPFMYVIAVVRSPRKMQLLLPVLCFLAVAGICIGIFWDSFYELYEKMFELGLSDNGRYEHYRQAIEFFLRHPLFGVGYVGTEEPSSMYFGIYMFHNTFFQLLACSGIVGVLGSVLYYVQRYRMLLKKISLFKLFALFAVLAFDGYGMIDVTQITPYLIFFVFLALAACERETDPETLFRRSRAASGEQLVRAPIAGETEEPADSASFSEDPASVPSETEEAKEPDPGGESAGPQQEGG